MGIIGAALGAVGSIFGGLSASNAMRRARRRINEQKESNKNWFERRYNEDATQRADAQRVLTLAGERLKNRNMAAAGTAAVMGSTTEAVAAEKEANAKAMADAAAQIATTAEARKDNVENQYRQKDAALDSQLNSLDTEQAKQTAEATKGVLGVAGALGL